MRQLPRQNPTPAQVDSSPPALRPEGPLAAGRRARWSVAFAATAVAVAGSLLVATPSAGLAPIASASLTLDLPELEERITDVAARASAATVGIRVGGNLGSGVIVSERGHVLTAGHVIEQPDRRVTLTLSDGSEVRGRTLGVNQWVDSGMVLIDDEGPWPHLEMGSVEDVRSGDWVLALGHPGGVEDDRPPVVRLGRVSEADDRVIRTDCTIVSGDSGGPLIDLEGRVIGIHTSLRPKLVANDHLPVDTYRRTWEQLSSGLAWGRLLVGGRARLGVSGERAADGMRITRVSDDSAADRAELRSGDVLTGMDGLDVDSFERLEQLISERQVGDLIQLAVRRGDSRFAVEVSLDSYRPRDAFRRPSAAVRIVPTPGSVWNREKYDDGLLREFDRAADLAETGTVRVRCDGRTVAFGTVVDDGGWVVTKASELYGDIRVVTDGRSHDARLVAFDETYDLALLHVPGADLQPVPFADADLAPGQWLVTPHASGGLPAAVGVLSVGRRSVPTRVGYLGVIVQTRGGAVRVVEVRPDSGAEEAGLEAGDVLLAFDGSDVSTSDRFTELIRAERPASTIRLDVWRDDDRDGQQDDDERQSLDVTLGEHPYEESQAVAEQDRQAGPLSTVRSGFPAAFQHDSVLRPEQCGGPLVDRAGRVVGVNLARAGRSASFAIPTRELLDVVERLKARASD